ncbi:Nn.00g089990.m01.CDS01 [Neocucurbitaria sp. VM-36]
MPSGSNADILDFDFTAGISSLGSLATMLNTSPDEEDQMALQRTLYLVAKPFSPAHLAPFAKSRIEYSIEQIKLVPRMMIEHNGTPWSHSRIYEDNMPRSLQDAHAACALYIAKNEFNAEYVTRFITNRVEEMTMNTQPIAPIELLARAHALMLYQIMLVFGGDIRFYGQAEALMPYLEETGNSLLAISAQQPDDTGSLPLYPSTAARAAWRAFIFRETVRRTVLSLFHFTAMCSLLRGQLKACMDSLAYGNRVTLSAHLWNAQNPHDFAVAWNDKKHFLVKDLDFTEVLREAKPQDLDIFARMMMVGLQGIDDIRGWFYTRGGTL